MNRAGHWNTLHFGRLKARRPHPNRIPTRKWNTMRTPTFSISSTSGQVEHIVLFQWTPEAKPEEIERAVEGLRALKDRIPGILDLTCGRNFTDRGKGYTHGLVVRFTDRAALESYGPHPEHQHVVQNYINPIRADVLALDYEL